MKVNSAIKFGVGKVASRTFQKYVGPTKVMNIKLSDAMGFLGLWMEVRRPEDLRMGRAAVTGAMLHIGTSGDAVVGAAEFDPTAMAALLGGKK